jgi:hypothetical protein
MGAVEVLRGGLATAGWFSGGKTVDDTYIIREARGR